MFAFLGKNSRLANKKILLLEAGKAANYANPDKYSNRVSAINPSTQQLMKEIGAWEQITRYAPVLKLQVIFCCLLQNNCFYNCFIQDNCCFNDFFFKYNCFVNNCVNQM